MQARVSSSCLFAYRSTKEVQMKNDFNRKCSQFTYYLLVALFCCSEIRLGAPIYLYEYTKQIYE